MENNRGVCLGVLKSNALDRPDSWSQKFWIAGKVLPAILIIVTAGVPVMYGAHYIIEYSKTIISVAHYEDVDRFKSMIRAIVFLLIPLAFFLIFLDSIKRSCISVFENKIEIKRIFRERTIESENIDKLEWSCYEGAIPVLRYLREKGRPVDPYVSCPQSAFLRLSLKDGSKFVIHDVHRMFIPGDLWRFLDLMLMDHPHIKHNLLPAIPEDQMPPVPYKPIGAQ